MSLEYRSFFNVNSGRIAAVLGGSYTVTAEGTKVFSASMSGLESIEGSYEPSDYYVREGAAKRIPNAPDNAFCIFDTLSEQWVDVRSLEDVKQQKWDEIKNLRDSLEFGGFEFESGVYDSDQVSQGRIVGAMIAGVDQVWTLADNTNVSLTASQLQQLYTVLQVHIASVHERGRIARQLIFEAESKEEVEGIQL